MPAPSTAIHRIVERCRAGDYAGMIHRLGSGWAVMGERQVFPGYCLLLPDPVVGHLNELPPPACAQFLSDMVLLGDALLACTGAIRINYAMLGNLEPALHAHLFPRHAGEPAATRSAHPWAVNWDLAPVYGEGSFGELKRRIAAEIASRSPSGAEQVMPLHR
jgi:diadenosine tetraphosphate (Ap4A) HIT family hydrolase